MLHILVVADIPADTSVVEKKEEIGKYVIIFKSIFY